MKVLYVGNYRHSWTTETHIARDLENLGHEVDRMQEPPGGGDHATLSELAARAQRGCSLVMWTRTWSLPPEATKLWRYLEGEGVTTASYHLDLYLGLQRQANIASDPFWTTQHVFTPDGNESSAEWFAAHGINHHWSPPAVVSDECATVMPGTFREDFAHDVVFVGSMGWPASYHEEWPWRAELLAWLESTYGTRFHRYAGDTGYRLDGKKYDGPVRGQHLNDLYASARVVIGDSCFAARDQRYWSDRCMEGWGRGAYMIFPRIDALSELIAVPPKDYPVVYPWYDVGDFAGLHDRIEEALHSQPSSVRASAAYMTELVAARHTYMHRLAAALEVMGLT